MELKIIKNEKSTLPRHDVVAVVSYADTTTPSRKELREQIAKKTHSTADNVIIKSIKTKYGNREAEFTAYVYENEEAMNKIEQLKMINKNKGIKIDKSAEKKE